MPDGISRTPGAVTAAEHYDTLLAGHYTWMSGGFEEKAAEQRALLAGLGLSRLSELDQRIPVVIPSPC
jgi:hypothetical protein